MAVDICRKFPPNQLLRGVIPAVLAGLMGMPSHAQTCSSTVSLTDRNAVNGIINVAPPPVGCITSFNITSNGVSTEVDLWFPYSWTPPVSRSGSVPFLITDTHASGATISLTGVKTVRFSDGQAFSLPDFTAIQSRTGTSPTPTPTPVPTTSATLVMPPSVPAAAASTDVEGVAVQNTAASSSAAGYVTFGQVFKQGALQPGNNLQANMSGSIYPVQMDAQALWPDGSIKFAAVTLRAPAIAGNGQLPVMLSKTGASAASKLSLAAAPLQLLVTLNFTGGQYAGTRTIDLGSALKTALSSAPDYWLNGSLATQARVDVPLPGGPMHLTADVTLYADQSMTADVQFNNDITSVIKASRYANPPALPPQQFSTTITLNGAATTFNNITQYQYQDWHAVVSSLPASSLNVQHDLAYLQHAGAVMPYDRTTGVSSTTLQNYQTSIIGAAGFGKPLAVNGVEQYMPGTGGRVDIGYTTQFNTAWLMTQDQRAAKVALAQGDTAGAVPWNIKLANGHWLTRLPSDNALRAWPKPEADAQTVANQMPDPSSSNWTVDIAHQPNLAYVPYLMTASRWYLDRLNAQAAYSITGMTYVDTCTGDAPFSSWCDIVVSTPGQQVRAQAWALREILEAAFIGKAGSWEQSYFNTVLQHNWSYLQFVIQNPYNDPWHYSVPKTALNSFGESTGWVDGTYVEGYYGVVAPWQQDYLSGVMIQGALMGYSEPKQFLNWQKNGWLAGRFIAPGMNPHDGCVFFMQAADRNTHITYPTWAQIEAKTVEFGLSNGTGWGVNPGNTCQIARAVLGGTLTVFPNDPKLLQALNWLNQSGAPEIDKATLQDKPTFNVVPLQ